MLRRVLAADSHCPIDLSAQLAAIVLERRGQRRIFGGQRLASRRLRGGPDANTICHGWMLEFEGARWAKARDSITKSRGTGWGKNIRIE